MSARKAIDLGAWLQRTVSYDELKRRLKKERADPALVKQLLSANFPDEYAAEQKVMRAAEGAARIETLQRVNEKRWARFIGESSPIPTANGHREVVAQVQRPDVHVKNSGPHNRVTDFSNWIYEAMPYGRSGRANLEAGKVGEREVAKVKLKRTLKPISEGHSGWQLIDKDPLDGKPKAQEISALKIGQDSLFGAPDYVYYNPRQELILIVEVKVHNPDPRRGVPVDGWPNLRAQLWAYGNIDSYLSLAANLVLIGEIWSEHYSLQTRSRSYFPLITYRWHMRDTAFCEQNMELFDRYNDWVRTCRSNAA